MKKHIKFAGFSLALPIFSFFLACSGEVTEKGEPIIQPEEQETVISGYTAPSYNDNYTGYSSWADKNRWNLANTHDPTVFKWTDGYWYMFGTDASYGNAHDSFTKGGHHFQGKRSKNLLDWEWVPGIMDEAPNWVVTKLNEYRSEQQLPSINKADISFGYWAPCARVVEAGGVKKVRIYYSIVVDNYIKSGAKASSAFDGSWTERAFIGVAESTNPNGGASAWEDKGFVVCSSSDKGKDGYERSSASKWDDAYFYFNAIDPSYFIDEDGSHWLVYGSWHSGFALVRINPETGKVAAVDGGDYLSGNVTGDFEMGFPWAANGTKDNPKPEELISQGYGTRIFSRGTSRWQPSEGPELVKYNGFYWLFFANDGLDVPYQTRVVRSEKIQGPYYALDGSEMTNDVDGKRNASVNIFPIVTHPYKFKDRDNGLGSCYGWVGISHCAVFNDGGDWYYMSQQRLPKDVSGINASNAVMMGGVRKIVWSPTGGNPDLWPMVLPERYGALPQSYMTDVKEEELVGSWQHIDLGYNYGKMDEALNLVISSNHTMSGALSGKWSFDSASQVLTFTPNSGTSVSVKVERELDWESSPRKPTIVYAGTQKNLKKSYWGKKSSAVVQ